MSAPAQPSNETRRPRRRPIWYTAAVLGLLVLAGGVASSLWYRTAPPEPPAVDLTGADPAVKEEVEAARQAVRKSPRSARAWGRLGMILATHQFTLEALQPLREAERLDPMDPQWPYHQALSLLVIKPDEGDETRPRLERAVALCGNKPDAPRLKLAELLLVQDRGAQAEQQFRLVLQDDPGNARAHLGLARLAFERNGPDDLQAALDHLPFAVGGPYTRKAAHVLRAQVNLRRNDAAAAARDEREAAALPPDANWPDPFAEEGSRLRVGEYVRYDHAYQLVQEGRTQEAERFLRDTLQAYPQSARNWVLLARARIAENDFENAEAALQRAIACSPEAPDAHVYRGIVQMNLKRPGPAEESFERATRLKPDYAFAWYSFGLCLERKGKPERALQAFDKALRCNPDHGDAARHREQLSRSLKH